MGAYWGSGKYEAVSGMIKNSKYKTFSKALCV